MFHYGGGFYPYHYGGYGNYGSPFLRDYNGDGLITSSDFREGAYRMGLGPMGANIAQSVFHSLDRNHNGYLDINDIYGYMPRYYY